MAFHTGQEVTMKSRQTRWERMLPNERAPKFGRIYTIREIFVFDGRTGLRFQEILNPKNYRYMGEAAFVADRFRPVVRPKTSIEIFKKMLPPDQHGQMGKDEFIEELRKILADQPH